MLEDGGLPHWVCLLLKDDNPWPVLDWNGTSWTLDGRSLDDDRELYEVYSSFDGSLEFGPNVADGPGVTSVDNGFAYLRRDDGTVQMVGSGLSRRESLQDLIEDWRTWIDEVYPAWKSESSNTLLCYRMLQRHPFAWRVNHLMGVYDPSGWVTEGLLELNPVVTAEGVQLETGGRYDTTEKFVLDTVPVWDPELTVVRPSFEEALVELARLVDYWYDPTGASKNNPRPQSVAARALHEELHDIG